LWAPYLNRAQLTSILPRTHEQAEEARAKWREGADRPLTGTSEAVSFPSHLGVKQPEVLRLRCALSRKGTDFLEAIFASQVRMSEAIEGLSRRVEELAHQMSGSSHSQQVSARAFFVLSLLQLTFAGFR
jgi:hypothetical protein